MGIEPPDTVYLDNSAHPLLSHTVTSINPQEAERGCFLAEQEIKVSAPVHDALLIETPGEEIPSVTQKTERVVAEASPLILDGFSLHTECERSLLIQIGFRIGGGRRCGLYSCRLWRGRQSAEARLREAGAVLE
jgi:hypothetical protein